MRRHCACATLLNYVSPTLEVIGRYALTPAAELTHSGSYTASISIRSGHGQSTHDRVFRFVPDFDTAAAAMRYACREGRRLLQQPGLTA